MSGFRGYVHSRSFLGERVPQHVQNIVIRDYCKRRQLHFLLSVVEYAMPDTYLMLKAVLRELPELQGVVAYSMFQLPSVARERNAIYQSILDHGKQLHFALEGLCIAAATDIQRVEDIWKVRWALSLSAPTLINP